MNVLIFTLLWIVTLVDDLNQLNPPHPSIVQQSGWLYSPISDVPLSFPLS